VGADIKKVVAWGTRHIPGIGDLFLGKTLPRNMSMQTIAVMTAMDQVGATLYNYLEKVNEDHRRKMGFWLTPREMLQELEKFRLADRAVYERGGLLRAQFHQVFRKR
jgi:hypothetical protein